MSIGEAIRTVLKKYAEFNGRAGRPEFWRWMQFSALVTAALNLLNFLPTGDNLAIGTMLSGVWGLAVLLPNLSVAVRRLRVKSRDVVYRFFGDPSIC